MKTFWWHSGIACEAEVHFPHLGVRLLMRPGDLVEWPGWELFDNTVSEAECLVSGGSGGRKGDSEGHKQSRKMQKAVGVSVEVEDVRTSHAGHRVMRCLHMRCISKTRCSWT